MNIQHRLLKFVIRSNWILFFALSLLGVFFAPFDVAKGIICGGLMVTLNFHFLYWTLRKSLTPPHVSSFAAALVKSYIRFVISAIILFFLISTHYVHPLGLFIGLSIVVFSIFAATGCELKKITFEEAV